MALIILVNINDYMEVRSAQRVQEEVKHFRSTTAFPLHFRPRHLTQLYEEAAVLDPPELRMAAARIDRDMGAACSRSVYVALKWLAFHHALLQDPHAHPRTRQRAADTLTNLPLPNAKANFEQHLVHQLFTPYRQYLLKLAAVQLQPEGQEEAAQAYCMFNLCVFARQELSGALRQFSRYFERFFPCLNEYAGRVGKDARGLLRRIRGSYEKGLLPMVAFLELDQLEGDLSLFDAHAQRHTNCWAFPETNARSVFFEEEEDPESAKGRIEAKEKEEPLRARPLVVNR